MKVCPKCSKKFEPDWSICLDCNELLQEAQPKSDLPPDLRLPQKKSFFKHSPIGKKILWIGYILVIPLITCFALTITHNHLEKKIRDEIIRQSVEDNEKAPEFQKGFLTELCANPQLADVDFCKDNSYILFSRGVSAWVAGTGLLLFLFILLIGKIGRMNRDCLVISFSIGLYISLIAGILLLVANGVVLMYTAYIAEVVFAGSYHPALIFSIGVIVLGGTLGLIKPAFGMAKKANSFVIGKCLSKTDYPSLWSFVQEAASKLNALMPENIIVGLGVDFYVTEASVTCLKEKLKGRTLFLSLPLMRKLNKAELLAIIGHELGHFRGNDTFYSRKFYPIYKGAREGLETLTPNEGDSNFVMLPVYALFTHFMDEFSKIEANIGRSRELLADKASAELTSCQTTARSLAKIYAFSNFWSTVENKMVQLVRQNQQLKNCSISYGDFLDKLSEEQLMRTIREERKIPHPTDTHPPLHLRLKELGFELADCSIWIKQTDGEPASMLLGDSQEKIEIELNEIEHARLFQVFGSKSN